MSVTTMIVFNVSGVAEEGAELPNAFLSAALLWHHLWERFVPKHHEHDSWITDRDGRLFALLHDARLTEAERVALLSTADGFVVSRENLRRYAICLREVAAGMKQPGHLPRMAALCDQVAGTDAQAGGWWWTSVTDNPWCGYNLTRDTGHREVFAELEVTP